MFAKEKELPTRPPTVTISAEGGTEPWGSSVLQQEEREEKREVPRKQDGGGSQGENRDAFGNMWGHHRTLGFHHAWMTSSGKEGQALPCVFRGAPVEEVVEQGAGRKSSATVQGKEAQGQWRRRRGEIGFSSFRVFMVM